MHFILLIILKIVKKLIQYLLFCECAETHDYIRVTMIYLIFQLVILYFLKYTFKYLYCKDIIRRV